MKRKAKKPARKQKKQELLFDVNQDFSGQDQFAFEMADDDAGFVFEADFEAGEEDR